MKKIMKMLGRVLAIIAVLCLSIITFIIVRECRKENRIREYNDELYSSECRSIRYSDETYAIKNLRTGEITIQGITWLFASDAYADSLVIYSKNYKRGYFNRYTGEAVIPEQYAHAWIFSEGLAAVVKDDKVGFINRQGKIVIDFKYPYLKDNDRRVDFVFHEGYCSMYDKNGKCGIINNKGEWVVKPQYDYVQNPLYGKRVFMKDDKYGVLDDSLRVVIPAEYDYIVQMSDYAIVTKSDETRMQVSYKGEILNPMLYDSIERLDYYTGKYLGDGTEISAPTGLYCYNVGNRCGLMDENGKLVTPPLYYSFSVVNKHLFRATLLDRQSGVLLNGKGETVESN
ncbi:WG repeat-containing protein [Bacteroides sp.]